MHKKSKAWIHSDSVDVYNLPHSLQTNEVFCVIKLFLDCLKVVKSVIYSVFTNKALVKRWQHTRSNTSPSDLGPSTDLQSTNMSQQHCRLESLWVRKYKGLHANMKVNCSLIALYNRVHVLTFLMFGSLITCVNWVVFLLARDLIVIAMEINIQSW